MESLIIALVVFFTADLGLRSFLKWQKKRKEEYLRRHALETGLQHSFSRETPTLKRVDLPKPRARILCVDDEPLILDSLLKILVLDGYAVDTVEQSREALHLVQFHHYDLALLDLRMPDIDGVSLTQWLVKLRPDIDIIIVTGYPSLESAVTTLKTGARDYLQKPFTTEELKNVVSNCLSQRAERLGKENMPRIRVVPLEQYRSCATHDFIIPAGVFISRSHCWVELNPDGMVRIGIDDFAKRVIGKITNLELPGKGLHVQNGKTLFVVHTSSRTISFPSPVTGHVVKSNKDILNALDRLDHSVYGKHWFCMMSCDDFEEDLNNLMIGKSAQQFFEHEVKDCCSILKPMIEAQIKSKENAEGNGSFWGKLNDLTDNEWKKLVERFFVN